MIHSRTLLAIGSLVLLLSLADPGFALQTVPSASSPSQQQSSTATPEQKGPQGFTLSPENYAKAVAYSRARYSLYFIEFIYGLLVLLLVLRWRLAPKYRDWAERASRARIVQAAIFTPLLAITLALLELPTSIYGHWLSRKYGISVEGWGPWTWDWTKEQLIAFLVGTILVWILYAVIRQSARRWWFYFWLSSLPIVVFLFFIGPVLIDPLFNKFEPLEKEHSILVTNLEAAVRRAGMNISPQRMFLMKASEKTTAIDAYVTGFGLSKRVVVFDNTIEKMTTQETVFVFGHEMGHYVLGHIRQLIFFTAVLLLGLIYLGFLTLSALLASRGERWGIREPGDLASLPALLLLLSIFSFIATPAANAFSRHVEHEADIYGLELTHDLFPESGEIAAQAFEVLGEVDLADPEPNSFIEFWLYTHPSVNERVVFARTYDPWGKGKSPKFVK